MHQPTTVRHQGGTKPYWLLIGLALATCVGESIIGVITDVLALLADAGHTLGDTLAVALAVWYESGHASRSDHHNHRLRTIIRIAIGLLITFAGYRFGAESIEHWHHPVALPGLIVIGTATLCAALNRAMLYVLGECRCELDKDLRAHVKSDFWISVGVAGGGLFALVTGYWWIDPLASSAISIWITVLGVQVIFGLHKD